MLPDLLRSGLTIVIAGTAAAPASVARKRYYAGRGNKFWSLLHDSALVPHLLGPESDHEILEHGIGLTDLNKTVAQAHDRGLTYEVDGFEKRIAAVQPQWVAFNGLTAGGAWARAAGHPKPNHGIVPSASIAGARVFVLPSSSGANARMPYNEKVRWWSELAALTREVRRAR